jgi:thioredoxin-related protein
MTLQKVDLYQDNTLPAKYGVRSTPTTIIIDSSGKALKTWVGEFDTAEMTTWLSTH